MRSFLMKWDSNRYRNLGLAQECDWQDLLHIDGRHWTGRNSFDAIFIDDERRKRRLLEGDFPSFSTTLPVFSDRARRLIEDLITPGGEWIRLNTGTGPFWGLNITDVRDALDRETSTYKCFDDGRVMFVSQYVLKRSALTDATFFKVKETARADSFLTGEVADRIAEAGLQGLALEEVALSD